MDTNKVINLHGQNHIIFKIVKTLIFLQKFTSLNFFQENQESSNGDEGLDDDG